MRRTSAYWLFDVGVGLMTLLSWLIGLSCYEAMIRELLLMLIMGLAWPRMEFSCWPAVTMFASEYSAAVYLLPYMAVWK